MNQYYLHAHMYQPPVIRAGYDTQLFPHETSFLVKTWRIFR